MLDDDAHGSIETSVSPSTPAYYYFALPAEWERALIEIDSSGNRHCAYLSIQPAACPVGDLLSTVKYRGYFQTFRERGAITLDRELFRGNGVFIAVVVPPTDRDCTRLATISPADAGNASDLTGVAPMRWKNATISVHRTLSTTGYIIGISAPFAALLVIIVTTIVFTTTRACAWARMDIVHEMSIRKCVVRFYIRPVNNARLSNRIDNGRFRSG